MMRRHSLLIPPGMIILALFLHSAGMSEWSDAQGSRLDYDRATALERQTRDRVFRATVEPQWIGDGPAFWYRVDMGHGTDLFVLVDPDQGGRRPAFDHPRMADALARASGRPVDPERLPFRWIDLDPQSHAVDFRAFDRAWRCDLATYEVRTRTGDEGATNDTMALASVLAAPRNSRAGGNETAIRFENTLTEPCELFWIDTSGGRTSYGALAPGASRDQHTYAGHVWLVMDASGGTIAVFEAASGPTTAIIARSLAQPPRFDVPRAAARAPRDASPDQKWQAFIRNNNLMIRLRSTGEEHVLSDDGTADDPYVPPFHWSPDSRRLVVLQTQRAENRQIHLIESSPRDQLQPRLHSLGYAKPGDRIARPRPRLFDIEAKTRIDIPDDDFANPWSLSDVRWAADSSCFTFFYNQRGHQVLRIVKVTTDGSARPIVDEQSPTFIDYAGKHFRHHLDATEEIIWMSERDGWNHLYLYDAKAGAVKNQITRGDWVVRGVERVDESARQIWFKAGGIWPEQDPYYVHLCRVNLDGSGLTLLTEGDGTHSWSFSPDGRYLIDTYSRVDLPPVTELRRTDDGSFVCELERADWSELLATGWRPPERFVAKGRDQQTDIHGVIVRPSNFDPDKRYPVIEQIYAGPQSAFVPKAFTRWTGLHAMAELGFIVVQIDGMGTSHRSKAFHDVSWKNLVDAGFPDRILWMQAAAADRPEMDLTRVGIYGGSAGGQNALAGLLTQADFYKVGVADCGCHDNRMDKIWWNELWMGWPVGPEYEANSNVALAHRLQGKLLLIVGELDRNVDPASTMQVVDALIRADKDFDLLIIPGAGHGAAETAYGKRRRADFFVRHLLGVEPRWEPRG